MRHAIIAPLCGLSLLGLAGCGDYAADYPKLLPTDQMLAPAKVPAHAADAASSPDAVRGQLEAEREAVHRGAQRNADVGDLSARAKALRERAEKLRNMDVSDGATSDCAPGDASCQAPANQ